MRSSAKSEMPVALLSLKRMIGKGGTDVDDIAQKITALSRSNSTLLSRRLRSHLLEAIETDVDIDFRAKTDDLISFYSYVEIGFITGSISSSDTLFVGPVLEVLTAPPVRRFYETFYPVALPGPLRLRLERRPVMASVKSDVLSQLNARN